MPETTSAVDAAGIENRRPAWLSTATWSGAIVRPGIESAFQTATVAVPFGSESLTGSARADPITIVPAGV